MFTTVHATGSKEQKNNRLAGCFFALFCLFIGQLTAYGSNLYFGHNWDKNLIKPSVTQFDWVFFVVIWTINYSTMGVAAWLVKRTSILTCIVWRVFLA
ncbi:TspO/MBR family protein [Spirosoma arcticum]